MPSLSPLVAAIRPGVFAELEAAIAARRARGGDLVPLHIGDTHRAPPDHARYDAVLRGSVDADLYPYGATAGEAALREAIGRHARAAGRGAPEVDAASNVLVGVGATHALSCAARAVLGPGDEVLLASPYWPLAHGILASTGARVVEVALPEDADGIEAAFARAIGPQTRAIYLITPNNPDGRVFDARGLAAIARLAVRHDLWVFSDEVYADYVFEGAHVSIAQLDGMRERTVCAYSFSKSHALAGVRVGYVLAPAPLVVAMRKLSTHSVFNVPVLAQRAALAALADRAWVDEARSDYRRARDAVSDALAGSGLRWRAADGGVYLFLDFADVLCGRPIKGLLERAVEHGVLLAPGEAFGEAHATCARLCYTSAPLPRVLEGVARLRAAITAFSRA